MSKGFISVLRLAESLSDAPRNGLAKSDVVARTGLPTSTVYRLLSDMEQAGYIYRTNEGRVLPNFSFDRRIALGAISPQKLRSVCAGISEELQSASEIILHRGHNLLWHITDEHPQRAIKLRAHPGYVRATYELDSISRLVLAHCEISEIERSWDLAGFYDVGVNGKRMVWDTARRIILATDRNEMQYDMLGNAKGVRRFCVAITDSEDQFVCLLTVAEAATPLRDEAAHVERIHRILFEARASLSAPEPEEETDPKMETGK